MRHAISFRNGRIIVTSFKHLAESGRELGMRSGESEVEVALTRVVATVARHGFAD